MAAFLRLSAAMVVFVGAFAAAGATAAVQLVDDLRVTWSIGANDCDEFGDCVPFDFGSSPPAPYVPWTTGGQSSTVTSQLLQGSGSGSSYSEIGWSQSGSVYEVVFDVVTPRYAHLSGELSTDILWGWPEAGVRLMGPGGTVYDKVINDSLFEDGFFDHTSLLSPGRYVIRVWADGGTPIADAWFDFELRFSSWPRCGVGAELAFLLPPLLQLRRLRSRRSQQQRC